MRSQHEQQNLTDSSDIRELQLLSEVDQNPDVTQRQLAQRVGIALGLTNLLLRNLVQKGYVKVGQASWKRRFYTLTPEGFFHRIGLMRTYVARVLTDYQRIRSTLRAELEPLALHAESRVAIYGTGEFAELIYLGLREIGIEEVDVFAWGRPDGQSFLGMPVREIGTLQPSQYDQIVVGVLGDWEKARSQLEELGASPLNMVAFFTDGKVRGEG